MSPDNVSSLNIKVNSANISTNVYDKIISVEVDDSVLLPSMFSIRLNNQNFTYTDGTDFALGNPVEIGFQWAGEDRQNQIETVMKGEITSIEPEMNDPAEPPIVVIRGYNKSHRLHRGKKTRTFLNVKDSDLASTIAGEVGLTAQVDSTSVTYKFVLQDNQTNMEFLRDRAQRNGYFVYSDNDKLYFVKAPKTGDGPILEWGVQLREFQARLSATEQVNEVKVRSWDHAKKQMIEGTATAVDGSPRIGESRSGGAAAQSAFGSSANGDITYESVDNVSAATALAKSAINEIGNSFVQAEGSCDGNPKLKAGASVQIKGVGTKFSGKYTVTRVVHRYEKSGRYITRFEVSGRRDNTLGQILAQNDRKGYGVVIGQVTNLNDPDKLARVKVKYPALGKNSSGAEIESDWARLVSPMAGADRGMEFIPEINDEVLVAFENDDIHRPFILGSLWSSVDKPPGAADKVIKDGKVNQRLIRSRAGHEIALDDTQGEEKLWIKDKTGNNKIEIGSKDNILNIQIDKTIEIKTKGGYKILIDDTGKKIELVCGSNSVKIDGSANSISIESASQLKIKAQTVQIEGTTSLDIKSTTMNLKANATMNVEGATATVKGSGMLTLQGGIVKIN